MITCIRCNTTKNATEFHNGRIHSNNRTGICKTCVNARARAIKAGANFNKKVVTDTHKLCTIGKKGKIHARFYKDDRYYLKYKIGSQCKQCVRAKVARKRLLNTPLPIFHTHKKCPCCRGCLPNASYYKKKSGKLHVWCKQCESAKGKKFRKNNPEKLVASRRKYYLENKPAILKKTKEYSESDIERTQRYKQKYSRKKADFHTFGNKLTAEDSPTNISGMLWVGCKTCKRLFQPTNSQCRCRVVATSAVNLGESHFYCSEKCKKECDIFDQHTIPKSLKTTAQKVRNCTPELKALAIAQQEAEFGYTYCDKCGEESEIKHLHHVLPIAEYLEEAHDSEATLLLCKSCHQNLHSSC